MKLVHVLPFIYLINNRDNLKQLLNPIENDLYSQIASAHSEFLNEFEEKMNLQVKTQEMIKTEIKAVFNKDKYMSTAAIDRIKAILKNVSSFKLLKDAGKNILPQGKCTELFNQIRDFLKDNRIFILECGEIERFVPDVGGHGNTWVEKTFEKYKSIDNDAYCEVKKFIKSVFGLQ